MPDDLQQFVDAVTHADADGIKEILSRSETVRNQIDAPLFSSDMPALVLCRNNRDVVDVLLDNGADINSKSQWKYGGFGVLHNTSPDMARYFIDRGAKVDLHAAAALDLMEVVERLIREEPSQVNAPGPDGQRPLHFAASPTMVEYLLDKGAHIDARCADHQSTAAQYATKDPHRCRFLMEQGAETDIFMACVIGDAARVQAMIDLQPDVINAHTPWGFNADEDGVGYDHPPTPEGTSAHIYLWTLGVNVTPHMVALKHGHEDVHHLLVVNSSPLRQMMDACVRGDSEAEERILTAHPGMDRQVSVAEAGVMGGRGLYEYHFEKQEGASGAVRTMVDAGFPLTMKAEMGATPLHWACWYGAEDATKNLLDFGAPLEIKDDTVDSTPLQWAVHGLIHGHHSYGGHLKIVHDLLAAGADAGEVSIPSGNREIDAMVGEYQKV